MKITLKERSSFIQSFRSQLDRRGLIEVDCPNIMVLGGYDPSIRSIPVTSEKSFLHNSPELYLKYCLATQDQARQHGLYYLGHVYRNDPKTNYHRKEFVMAEWYRPDFRLSELLHDTLEIIYSLCPFNAYKTLDLAEEFNFNLNSDNLLRDYLNTQNVRINPDADYMDLFSLFWLHCVEEKIKSGVWIVVNFPAQLRSMAKLHSNPNYSLRAEICMDGIEIANAYEEETESSQILEENHPLFGLLSKMGPCAGIALGVDRLLLVAKKMSHIDDVTLPVFK